MLYSADFRVLHAIGPGTNRFRPTTNSGSTVKNRRKSSGVGVRLPCM